MYEILSYQQMCLREGERLQKGMTFRPNPQKSIFLMSVRANAPYPDRYLGQGGTIIYQGHNKEGSSQKNIDDQPIRRKTGKLTENGKFYEAAMAYLRGISPPPIVRIYQKLIPGIWTCNGLFLLMDAWEQLENCRRIFYFSLEPENPPSVSEHFSKHDRYIPSRIRAHVYQRDRGRCSICQSTRDLHFDHIIPVSKGGSSKSAKNIQLLCSKHNLRKADRIE